MSLTPEGEHMRVSLASVEAPHQGKGIAPNLYESARKYAGEHGYKGITSDWRYGTDPKAADVWRKFGADETKAPNGESMFILRAK